MIDVLFFFEFFGFDRVDTMHNSSALACLNPVKGLAF